MENLRWLEIKTVGRMRFVCGHCGDQVGSEKGWRACLGDSDAVRGHIFVCPSCTYPTFFRSDGARIPAAAFGGNVANISEPSIDLLYNEARRATAAGCYTAAVLCCRKLLMHIAVAKGAKENQNFVAYVEFLSAQHYVPPDAKGWVDHIRQRGNEANHEITMMKAAEAQELMAFMEMLLKLIYEFPAAVKKNIAAKP